MKKWMFIFTLGTLVVLLSQSQGFSKDIKPKEIKSTGDMQKVLENQAEILSKLAEIQKELHIIKIRASS
jgi:hypothetical protein